MRRCLPATLAVLFLWASPAAIADDASVKQAWDANDAEFTKLGREVRKAYRRWAQRRYTNNRPLLRKLRRARRLLHENTANVRAEPPSSEIGAQAKSYALKSNRAFDRDLAAEIRGVRARTAGRHRAADRAFRAADRFIARSHRLAKKAKALFKQVGVSIAAPALVCGPQRNPATEGEPPGRWG